MRRFFASTFSMLAFCGVGSLALVGCSVSSDVDAFGDDISCDLSVGFANGRSMDEGRGVVYGAPLAPVPDVLARGTVEDLRFSVPTRSDTEDTPLEPSISVEGDVLAATHQALACATADSALLDGRIEARSVGTGRIVVEAADGVNDAVSFEVREATSLGITGPTEAAAGDEIYLAAALHDASERPLYASSSVSWSVVEGDVTFPDADDDGALHGAFALVKIEADGRAVVRADAIGFSATFEIGPANAE